MVVFCSILCLGLLFFVLLHASVVIFCSITCFSGDVLFYHMFQWWCFVLFYVSVFFFLFYYMFQWCCFVLLHVSVVVFCSILCLGLLFVVLLHVSVVIFCSITCFSGDILFYYLFQW